MPALLDILRETWLLVLQSALYLLAGFVLAGLIHAFVPTARLVRWLGTPNWRSVLKAAALGTPLPLCSCAVVPVAAQLRKAGASRGATTAFLISTPESGADSIAITYALLDPAMTVARPFAALLTAFVAGLAENRWGLKERAWQQADAAAPVSTDCCAAEARAGGTCDCDANAPLNRAPVTKSGLFARCFVGLRYALVDMFEDLAVYLVAGFVIAGVLSVALKTFDPLRLALASPWAPFIMLAAGVPMYVCAAAATPMIAVLISQGLSPGAGLVFLLAGPATNAASLVLLHRILGRRAVVIYLAAIAVCALAAGLGVNAFYAATGWMPRALTRTDACCAATSWLDVGAAGALLLCTAYGVWRHYRVRLRRA